jgi:hypothetical protein
MKTTLLLLVFAGGSLICTAADSVRPASTTTWLDADDPALRPIRQAAEAYISQIGQALITEVQMLTAKDGTAKAIEKMHLKNVTPPEPAAGQPRVAAFKLISLKLRNPANDADEADLHVLKVVNRKLQEGDDISELWLKRVDTAGQPSEWRAYRPLAAMPLCLQCHGPTEKFAPDVKAQLDRLYPKDKAVDYAAYNWRGLVRVSITRPEPAAKK